MGNSQRLIETQAVVVGAGTAGSYIAWKLSEAGFGCVVLEKERLDSLGTSIGPFHMEESAFGEFGLPLPQGDELLHTIDRMTMWSPSRDRSHSFSFPTLVMDKPLFTRRLHRYARQAGAEIIEGARVDSLMRELGVLRGVSAETAQGRVAVRGEVVIDASGIESEVRTRMPESPWFENDPISPSDTIFVYMETWSDIDGDMGAGVNTYPDMLGWYAPGPGETTIVGVGAGGGFEAARRRHREMVATLPFRGRVLGSAMGRVPYRRPPMSLVDNGLMVVGDAACMNKPFSGEGVTSGFTGCSITVDVAAGAIAGSDATREALWSYNARYFRDQGAKFAMLLSVLPAAAGMRPEEMDYLFDVPGLLTEEGSLAMQRDFELGGGRGQAIEALPGILGGMLSGRLGASSLLKLAVAALNGWALRRLYERYPEHPFDFPAWKRKAIPLWKRADRARYRYFAKA